MALDGDTPKGGRRPKLPPVALDGEDFDVELVGGIPKAIHLKVTAFAKLKAAGYDRPMRVTFEAQGEQLIVRPEQ